ncbi:MAG: BtrH N-terminal domain-containing protein [Muribaculaceae bacterium]|nr:BtrH N-terminal domain-containing protein [Muribaculaceae bacterium]
MREILDVEVFTGLLEIDPNKGYPFVTCTEMAFLSVMKYYNKNILAIMVKMNFLYEFYTNNEYVVFLSINPDFYTDSAFFNEIGITKKVHTIIEDKSLECIKKCIENKHPVQFRIDLYYQKDRDFFYKTQHALHYLVGYGFDDEKQKIYMIDNLKGYDKYEINYKDYSILRGEAKNSDVWEFIESKKVDTYSEEFVNKMLGIYVNGIKNQQKMREDALESINLLIDQFGHSMGRPEFATNINSVIYSKTSELYRMIFLEKYHLYSEKGQEKIEGLLKKIITFWKKIYLSINYRNMSFYSNDDYEKEIKYLEKIYIHEKELCECLVAELVWAE